MKTFKEIIEYARDVRLAPQEKAQMLHVLKTHMARRPAGGPVEMRTPNHFGSPLLFWLHDRLAVGLPLVVGLLVIASGVAVGAEQSGPDGLLYPLKVGLTEPLRGALTFSSEGKAAWEGRLAIRRLTEIEAATAAGGLNPALQTRLATQFNEHVTNAQKRLESIRAAGGDAVVVELSGDLEANLRAHDRVLGTLRAKEMAADTAQPAIATFAAPAARLVAEDVKHSDAVNISPFVETFGRMRQQAEDGITAAPEVATAAAGARIEADAKIAEVEKLIGRFATDLASDTLIAIQSQLAVAQATRAEGQAKFEAGEYVQAFSFFHQAHRDAQEAQEYLHARRELEKNQQTSEGVSVELEDSELSARTNGQASSIETTEPVVGQGKGKGHTKE